MIGRVLLICVATLVTLGWCPSSAALPQRPQRIISLIPAVTEILFAVGAGPQVVAVSSFDRYPPEVASLAKVGALLDPDLEKILALEPDLVVVYGTQTDLRRQLERAGVSVYVYSHAGLRDVTTTIRQVGARVGLEAKAVRTAGAIEAALEAIRKRVAGRPRPRALVIFGREPGTLRGIYASGGVGFIQDMLEVAGGTNVFEDVRQQSVQATSELVLARRPEVIIELHPDRLSEDRARRETAAWSVLRSVPAVRNGRVYLLGDERTVVPGPRVAEGTELIARALHPGVFR